MSSIGKLLRLRQLLSNESGRAILVPIDHGVTYGPIDGLKKMDVLFQHLSSAGIDGVICHNGIMQQYHQYFNKNLNLILHLSASTMLSPSQYRKVIVNSVENAVRSGATAVSIHVNLGNEYEDIMLQDFGNVVQKCNDWGMPLIAMVYCRGDNIDNKSYIDNIKLAARVAAELGADLVKINYTGDKELFHSVVEGCPVPILIAGGEKIQDELFYKMLEDALDAGAMGVALGRNVFQSRDIPGFLKRIKKIVHETPHRKGLTLEKALL